LNLALLFLLMFACTEIASALLPFDVRDATDAGLALHYAAAALAIVLLSLAEPRRRRAPPQLTVSGSVAARWLRRMEFAAAAGVIILVVSLALQGVSYSEGVAAARESMRSMRDERGGGFSSLSLLGNLLAAGSFACIGAGVVLADGVPGCIGVFVRQWTVVLVLCVLTGGREPAWIAIGVTFGACALRASAGKPFIAQRLALPLFAMALAAASMAFLIAQWRMDGYGGRFNIEGYCEFLGGVPRDGAATTVPVPGAAAPIVAYLAHTRWLSIETFSGSGDGGLATLRVVLATLARNESFGWLAPGSVSFSGRWIPGAASAWFDLGVLGLILFGCGLITVGRLFGQARDVVCRTGSPLAAAAGAMVGCLCFTAPMQFAFETLSFVYAVGFLVVAMAIRQVATAGARNPNLPPARRTTE